MTLVLPLDSYETVLDHAREGAPEEVCGVLGGCQDDREATVDTVRSVPNVADTPRTRYELDPERQLAVIEGIETDGGDVIGFYHSHPEGPPEPSATDRTQASWPEAYYLIVSLAEESVTAWYWTGEEFRETPIAVN